ncbi:MAG: dihydrofolate reductase [Opitutae bacterium]|nr:dihydrofolate reductase [Opitutae bacterium]
MSEFDQHKPDICAIAAMAKNRVIGNGNALPWRIPEDFKFFKATTMGGILLMGRKTYESIGKPLAGRITAVLSRTLSQQSLPENVFVLRDFSELPQLCAQFPGRQVFLCGGAEIYRQFLPSCSQLFLTHVDAEPSGDAEFPPFENMFDSGEVVKSGDGFCIKKYTRNGGA